MKAKIGSMVTAFWMGCALLTPIFGQPEDIISRSYFMKDGLSHDFATCIFQDSQGFIWVGSESGLNKFDGYHFTTYRENPSDSNSLANNWVNSLWEDKQQRLWIGTAKGLELFDLKAEKFYHPIPDSLNPTKGFNVVVRTLRERKDGKLWICTSQGIYLADPETLSITKPIHFPQDEGRNSTRRDSLNGNYFLDIAEAPDGSIWAASGDGLVHMDVHTGQATRYRYDPDNPQSLADDVAWTVHVDRQNRVWVGTGHGLDLFNPEDQSFTHFLPERLKSNKFLSSKHYVQALLEPSEGKLWVGFGNGLYTFDPETEKFDLLVDKYIWTMFKDRQGSIWVGSPHGLFQIVPQSKKFTTYRQFGKTNVSEILSLAEDADHHIWISSYNTDFQLFIFDPSNKNFFQYPHNPLNPQSFSGIRGIIPDREGYVWLASKGKLEKFNPQNQTFTSIALPIDPTTMLIDSQGKIWLGAWDRAGMYDPLTETYERLASFPNARVYAFLEDREENIWAGTSEGLVRYNLRSSQLDIFKHDPTDPQSLSHNRIYHLMMDKEGALWIGTGGGLNKMIPGTEKDKPKFIHWQTTQSYLPHDDVFCVVDGGDGTLWMGCGNKISHFFQQEGVFRNYDYHDGLPGQRIVNGVGLRSHNGKIYFGSIDGLVVFHPDSLQNNSYTPPVTITSFSIHNQAVPVQKSFGDSLSRKSPLTHAITYTDEVDLTYRQNDFSLDFAALNFVNSENNLYKYKLEPYEKDWIETSASNRTARYTNLSPGRYTFRIIGSNNDGLWNEAGKSLSIIILPPWWQTWWAYSLYALLALGMILSIRYYELKRFKLRQQAIHLSELDSLKSRFFANISHEFRTPLTLILGPVKKLMDKHNAAEDQSSLSGIQRNAKRLLHLVNQLLELSKLEAGKLKLEPVKSDIVAFLERQAYAFSSLADHKNIHFAVELPDEKIGVYFDPDKLEKIINNLLSNAFKFTSEGETVNFKVQSVTQGNKDWIKIQVTDTGKGIPEEEINRIFDRFYQVDNSQTREGEGTGIGLALTKELVELHHGEISVESTSGEGTIFTIALPLGKEHLNEEEIIQELPIPEEATNSVEPGIHPSALLAHPSDNILEKEGTEQQTEKPVVLIVEDNQEVRRFIGQSISGRYQVQEAAHGVMGLDMAKALLPDLIISDVMMPQMDGYQLCEKIKTDELTAHIPVILLTARADRQSKLTGLATRADDYLSKPFDSEELLLIIRNRIEERRKMQQRFSRDITLEPKHIAITSLDEQFLQRVMHIIEEHMDDENFTIEELSQQAGYSHMHFYRKIKALTDQTPSQFLRTIRLKRAAAMLQKKSDHVTQIAYNVGFSSLSYFNKCFKEQFGKTPTQFAAETQAIK